MREWCKERNHWVRAADMTHIMAGEDCARGRAPQKDTGWLTWQSRGLMSKTARLIQQHIISGQLDEASLDPYELAYVKAANLRDGHSFALLRRVVAANLPTGVHSHRGIEKLIRIHFGVPISFVSVRTDLRCRNEQVEQYQTAVREAMAEILERLREKLVELA